jgi:hypothetical protein
MTPTITIAAIAYHDLAATAADQKRADAILWLTRRLGWEDRLDQLRASGSREA